MNNDLEQYAKNSFTDSELEFMALGNNPVANAYRELLAFRRAVKQAKPIGVFYPTAFYIKGQYKLFTIDEANGSGLIQNGILNSSYSYIYTTPQPAHTEQDGWIKCSERMPEVDEHKPIAIYTGNCIGQGMFVACYDEDGFYDYWDGVEISGISHWMPLPPPPIATPKPESE